MNRGASPLAPLALAAAATSLALGLAAPRGRPGSFAFAPSRSLAPKAPIGPAAASTAVAAEGTSPRPASSFSLASAALAAVLGAGLVGAASRGARGSRCRGDRIVCGTSRYTGHERQVRILNKQVNKYHPKMPPPFYPGTNKTGFQMPFRKPPTKPGRMCLSKVQDPKLEFTSSDFYKASPVVLKGANVKQVSSYKLDEGEYVQGASFPKYQKPQKAFMFKEKGEIRAAQDGAGYKEHAAKLATLAGVAPKQGVSLADKDFVADRMALIVLFDYVGEVRKYGDKFLPVDYVKVTKVPGGKGLFLECIQDKQAFESNRKYKGAWVKGEMSDHGDFFPAFHRCCTGGADEVVTGITGLRLVAGSTRGGRPDERFRFVEYGLGDFSMLVRTPSHLEDGGNNVEISTKNAYARAEVLAMDIYRKLLLGGTDKYCLGLHRSGKIQEVCEFTLDNLEEQTPGLADAVHRRLGRLTAMLGQVKDAMANVPEGEEYVLQRFKDQLRLGRYELSEKKKTEKKEKVLA